jgi:conjugal transfer pilin signal peptidase TrbI
MAATAVSDAPRPGWRPRRHLWGLLGLFIACSVVFGAIVDWRQRHVFLINASDSLPNWAFLIQRGAMPARDDYVFFDPPHHPLVVRHFGPRPSMFGKVVYGVAGDIVSHDGLQVRINGRTVARMKPMTRFGEPLTPGATGPIPRGCFFAGSPHPDGFDSRYAEIGFVCRKQIIGVGEPIL